MAARGTSLELKSRYGAGYTLAMVLEPGADLEQLAPLVASHVPGAELLSAAAAEASFRWVGCWWVCGEGRDSMCWGRAVVRLPCTDS